MPHTEVKNRIKDRQQITKTLETMPLQEKCNLLYNYLEINFKSTTYCVNQDIGQAQELNLHLLVY